MARKQTSARISSAAARLLAKLPKRGTILIDQYVSDMFLPFPLSVATLRSICASALSQDETKGQKQKPKRGKGRK